MKNNQSLIKNSIMVGCFSFFLAIAAGAFGAHGLKHILDEKFLTIFETAVDYHYLISISLILVGILGKVFKFNIKLIFLFLVLSLFLFSGNLYLYVFSKIKVFAMLVPLGGVSFMISYLILFFKIKKNINI